METNWPRRVGAALMVLVTVFLVIDAGMKIAGAQPSIAATVELGFSAGATRVLGWVLGAATVLYVIPVTRVFGAILLTGYLGGAVAVQAQYGSPVPTHVLFGVYVGVTLWASIWLRSADLRRLIPFQRRSPVDNS